MSQCSICLAEADDKSGVLCPSCQEVFHKDCLIKWLQKNKSCPACKQPISDISKTVPISRVFSKLNINPQQSPGSSGSSNSSSSTSTSKTSPGAVEDKNDTTPLEFVCPLTHQIMSDPMLLPDGVSYERAAIQAHLDKNGKSPKTGQAMAMASATPNVALKSLIGRYLHPESASVTTTAAQASLPTKLDVTISAVYEGENIHVQVKPNGTETRPETIIVAVVDTSGSMDLDAAEKIGHAEDLEITRLQLVQFSLKTVVNSLEPRDGLVLYHFAEDAQRVFALTRMDAAGKTSATAAIDALRAEGGTSIWEAAKVGAQTALQLQGEHPEATIKVMLFTDGEPTCRPPMGEMECLKELLEEMPERRFTMSTFSYGYQIDSGLMDGIAQLGWGVYGYCPDASLVGTIFINYLAQAMNCLAQHVEVDINGRKTVLSLHIGQTMNFLERGDPKTLQVAVRIPSSPSPTPSPSPSRVFVLDKAAVRPVQTAIEKEALLDQLYRQRLVAVVRDNLSDAADGLAATQALYKEIKGLPTGTGVGVGVGLGGATKTPFLAAVQLDLIDSDDAHGQVGKAFDAKFYGKWGKDYLRSFARFHERETCGNFKDESLQLYQTPQFGITRRLINKIFMAMPPLKGRKRSSYADFDFGVSPGNSPALYSSSSGSASPSLSSSTASVTVDQDDWYDRHGGCWGGDAVVSMWAGGLKRTRDVRKGDVLESGATVECVVELVVNGMAKAVRLGETLWTPWHPVRVEGQWVYACMCPGGRGGGPSGEKLCCVSSWYDLVVKGGEDPVIRVNGIETVTLGHGLCTGVVAHGYFGTNAVVEGLQKWAGYTQGHVRVEAEEVARNTVRDEEGMVVRMF